MSYFRPDSVDEAVRAMAARPLVVLAGGTDHYPARVGSGAEDDIIDISALGALGGIAEDAAGWRIGALVTWIRIAEAKLPPLFDGLKRAAREVGGAQVQNRGTVGGNLCNASPAADGVPPLLSLDAEIELASARGARFVPLAEYITGNQRTVRRPDELLAAVRVKRPANPARGDFLKLGARRYLVISIAMAAGVIERGSDGRVAAARIAVGACSEVARRLPELERDLVGRGLDGRLGAAVEARHTAALSPIDDVRGSAAYRRDAAATLLRRMLDRLGAA